MELLCLGDIALADLNGVQRNWAPPLGMVPGEETKILFNWEFPIGQTVNPAPRSSGPRLLAHPDSPGVIQLWSPGFASLATNHVLDGGQTGLFDTLTSLRRAGFTPFGAGVTPATLGKPLIWETGEGRLTVINWVFPETHPDWMCVPGPNCWPGPSRAGKVIQSLKQKVNWVMVLAHWSDELFPYPRPEDRQIASGLAAAGADLIVCHHPHVVRGLEVIGTCPVFYSLGNYFFSEISEQDDRQKIEQAPRNREGLGVSFSFNARYAFEWRLFSFWQENGETIQDPRDRAVRRLRQTSVPLRRLQPDAYAAWYSAERTRFDQFWGRWHFGVRKLGLMGLGRWVINRFSDLLAQKEGSTRVV